VCAIRGQAATAMHRAEAGVAHAGRGSGAVKQGGIEQAGQRLGLVCDAIRTVYGPHKPVTAHGACEELRMQGRSLLPKVLTVT
jgi:hypothetical protein